MTTRSDVRTSRWRTVLGECSRFGVVGLLAFAVDVGGYNLFALGAGVGPLTSKTVAVALATTFAYVANRHWAFANRGRRSEQVGVAAEFGLFVALNVVGLLLALACLGASYYLLGMRSALAQNVSANGVGLALGTAFRFWSYRRWVFPAPEAVSEPARTLEPCVPSPISSAESPRSTSSPTTSRRATSRPRSPRSPSV